MARARRFSRGSSLGHSRRKTSWNEGPGGTTPTQFTSTGEAILGGGVAANLDGVTVIRIRGQLDFFLTSVAAAIEGFHGAFGICVVNEDAFAVGSSAIPDPLADQLWDGWMYHHFFDVHAITGTIADGVNAQVAHQRIEVDTKAMRKTPTEEVVVGKLEVVENGTAVMNVFFESRMLVKLP